MGKTRKRDHAAASEACCGPAIIERGAAAAALFVTLENEVDEIEAGYEATFGPLIKSGERLPPIRFFLQLYVRLLAALRSLLVVADRGNAERLADLAAARERRRRAIDESRDVLHTVRDATHVLGGRLRLVPAGPVSRRPAVLLGQALTTQRRLRRARPGLGGTGAIQVNAVKLLRSVRAAGGELRAAHRQVERLEHHVAASRAARREAISAFDCVHRGGLLLLRGLCLLVGCRRIAARLQRRRRRSTQPAAEEAEEVEAGGAEEGG